MNTSHIFEVRTGHDPTGRELTLVRFFGFVDAATVQQIRPAIQRQIPAQSCNLVIDLKDVGFLDSHGIGLFVSFLKQAHRNSGRIIFAGATGQPASMLRMVGLNGAHVSYCASTAEAFRLFDKEKTG